MKNYQTLQDFVTDARFCNWVAGTDPEADAFWEAQMEAYPEKAKLVRQAKTIVLALRADGEQLGEHEKTRLWHEIQNRRQNIGIKRKAYTRIGVGRHSGWHTAAKVAAGVAAILLLGILYFWQRSPEAANMIAHKTGYGEVKHLLLPDGSAVVLNANSVLRFPENWSSRQARGVELEGEAFFSVVHRADEQKFKVKLADNLAVEVLGTKFTVTRRPLKTRIVLSEGKVAVAVNEAKWPGASSETEATEVLAPGELLELNLQADILVKKQVADPASYAAFQHQKLVFTDAPLSEVARVLKDNYGYETVFLKADVQRRRFTGTTPANRLDLLFTALERLYDLKIVAKGKQIKIDLS